MRVSIVMMISQETYSAGRGQSAIDVEQADGVFDRTLVERRDD
jgi:hypothetical protein